MQCNLTLYLSRFFENSTKFGYPPIISQSTEDTNVSFKLWKQGSSTFEMQQAECSRSLFFGIFIFIPYLKLVHFVFHPRADYMWALCGSSSITKDLNVYVVLGCGSFFHRNREMNGTLTPPLLRVRPL